MWRICSRNSFQKFEGVKNCTRGVFFLIPQNLVENFSFWPSLSRRDVSTSRRYLNHEKPGLGNVATLDLNVATLAVPPPGTS